MGILFDVSQMHTKAGLLYCVSPFKHPKLKVASDQETLDSPAPLSAGDQFCKHRISNE